MKKLEELIRQWIRAEFMFRLSDKCYSDLTQSFIIEMEEELREAVTGKADLAEAAKVLGLTRKKKRIRIRPEKPNKKTTRNRIKKRKGFF